MVPSVELITAGHGRSNVLLCASLVEEGQADNFTEAHKMVQRARPRAKLNLRQRQALVDWQALRSHSTDKRR